jgi:hypothetical protein
MEMHRELATAIESFDHWGHPWEFYSSVSALLSPVARGELERVWATATDTAGWSTCKDLAHGSTLANTRLSVSYPWLSTKARQQLVNGAAYQWR